VALFDSITHSIAVSCPLSLYQSVVPFVARDHIIAYAYRALAICYRPSVRPTVTRAYHTTRSQAVARIADRTATQQTHVRSYAKNYRGHTHFQGKLFMRL